MDPDRPDPAPAPPPAPAPRPRVAATLAHGIGRLLLWLPGAAIGLLLAGMVALWFWAATPGSLAQALSWADDWLAASEGPQAMRLQATEVTGSLRHGGRIGTLRWSQGALSVQADALELVWDDSLWTNLLAGQGLRLPLLRVAQLSVHDERPPSPAPSQAPTALDLPLPLSLDFELQRLQISGRQDLLATDIRGQYRYAQAAGMGAHRLRLDSLQWAQGSYRAQVELGAQAPMALNASLEGDIRTALPSGQALPLKARLQASGHLAGADAAITLNARLQPSPPAPGAQASTLSLQAQLRPWADLPLHSATLRAQALDLAPLWPGAPTTAISGELLAQPEGADWHATLRLDNPRAGPADQRALPLQSLQAELRRVGERWTLASLQARLGEGSLQAQGSGRLLRDAQGRWRPVDWTGGLRASGLRADRLWSTLSADAFDAQLSARSAPEPRVPGALALQASVQVSPGRSATSASTAPAQLALQARWLPEAGGDGTQGALELDSVQLHALAAELQGRGRVDTRRRDAEGQWTLSLPGAHLMTQWRAAHADGEGELTLQIEQAERVSAWLRSLRDQPWWGDELRQRLAQMTDTEARGAAEVQLSWRGGLGALGWPAPTAPVSGAATPLRLDARLSAPRLDLQRSGGADVGVRDLVLQVSGPQDALALSLNGQLLGAGWQLGLESEGRLALARVDQGRLDLARLRLLAIPEGAGADAAGWQLANAQPLRLAWQREGDGTLGVDAGSGLLALRPVGPPLPELQTPLSLAWQSLAWQAQTLQSRGQLTGLTLPWLDAFHAALRGQRLLAPNGVDGDLTLDGDWDLQWPLGGAGSPALALNLQRRGGDIRWNGHTPGDGSTGTGSPLTAGVRDARVRLTVQGQRLQALLRWDTERLGVASADLDSPLAAVASGEDADPLERWWPARSPLQGTAQVALPQVGVWSLLAPPGWRMQGTLQAQARLAGTRGAPQWSGSLQAEDLALRSVVEGIAFTQGRLNATLEGERIRVERLSLQGAGEGDTGGRLDASGQAEWRAVPGSLLRQPFIELQARAQQLRVSSRPDRRLTVSGDASATLAGTQLQLRGQLRADSALFILPDETTPSLGKDVVVRHTKDTPAEAPTGQRVQPDIAFTLDLGPQFEVRGQGLQTRLEGQLSLRANPASPTPRVLGEVRTAGGSYRAYDQSLRIASGALRFTGPYDDPALDIRAVRVLPQNTDQTVGVQIGGHAQAPRVTLFADPVLPDGETLAWLVLGRPASSSGAQAFVLQQAARRLLSRQGEPLDGALARSLGIDEIGFSAVNSSSAGTGTSNTTTSSAALTLGKRLSSDLYLSYEQSLAGTMSTVSILYDLSRRLTLRARAGTENAIDLIFTQRYD